MKSKCCGADAYAASSRYNAHMENDWYECVECERPCDMMELNQPWTGDE